VNGLAERLPCGVPLLALVEQVSGARSPDDPAHQTRCPHCRRALGRIRAVLDEVRRLAADPVAIPPGLARQVMERLRGKPTEIPLAPGPRGRTSVSDATVAQVARRAALTAPGVVFASALVVSGTAGESLRVTVHLVVAFGPPIGEVAARVRERVARDVARLAGIRPDAIEIAVDDIAP
jgi:uncharacterized alkaline shock family protein YloU